MLGATSEGSQRTAALFDVRIGSRGWQRSPVAGSAQLLSENGQQWGEEVEPCMSTDHCLVTKAGMEVAFSGGEQVSWTLRKPSNRQLFG